MLFKTKKQIREALLISNCKSLVYTVLLNVLSWISFEVLNQLSLRRYFVVFFHQAILPIRYNTENAGCLMMLENGMEV